MYSPDTRVFHWLPKMDPGGMRTPAATGQATPTVMTSGATAGQKRARQNEVQPVVARVGVPNYQHAQSTASGVAAGSAHSTAHTAAVVKRRKQPASYQSAQTAPGAI